MKQNRIIALVTAKGGNQSLENKNIIPIAGIPSVLYSIRAAKGAKSVSDVFVTTEDPRISSLCKEEGARVIDRPRFLAQPLTNHGDVIQHAYKEITELTGGFDILIVLLGNTVMTTSEDIETSIKALQDDVNATSAMTVWVAQDDHPFRAMYVGDNGYLKTFMENQHPDTNRQSYPEVLYYDQGPWTVRTTTLDTSHRGSEAPGPWWWMGDNCIAIKREWVTGRDTHTELDLSIAYWWLTNNMPSGKANPKK